MFRLTNKLMKISDEWTQYFLILKKENREIMLAGGVKGQASLGLVLELIFSEIRFTSNLLIVLAFFKKNMLACLIL